jgi:hypothetical protein
MRRYALFLFLTLMNCSRPDFDTSVRVEAWLRSLDPDAEVLEVWCIANVDVPPGSGNWQEIEYRTTVSARQATTLGGGLDLDQILSLFVRKAHQGYTSWLIKGPLADVLTEKDRFYFSEELNTDELHCDGKHLKSPPPITVGKCVNDIDGCEGGPPVPEDPLPPLPPPSPGGDF